MSTIKTFGQVDARSLEQLKRCMEAGDAEFGVLCADHHPGYAQPIGGGIAYEGYVSPSGVGYDIGCLAAGSRVTTTDGSTVAVQEVMSGDPVASIDHGCFRRVAPVDGSIARGVKPVLELRLENGRALTLTPDHRVRTRFGWAEAGELAVGDEVLCSPFIGLPRERFELHPALIRLLAYVSVDGHVSRDGKAVSIYTVVEADADALCSDARELGLTPHVYRRERGPGRRLEINVRINSKILHRELAELGSPVGKKRWDRRQFEWLLDAPAFVRATFLSSFASAEMCTPRLTNGWVANLALKQADPIAARRVIELLTSLGYRASLGKSANHWLVQVLGGEEGLVRFVEEVGFCRAAGKRIAAASVASVAWQRRALIANRLAARVELELQYAAGDSYKAIIDSVSSRFGVSRGFVHHAIYDARPSRRGCNALLEPRVDGEGVWVPIESWSRVPACAVYDVVTGDPSESFLAEGVVVHNCGNKAVQTRLTGADLDALGGVEKIMGEVTRRISFGMGVPAQERADHPVLDKIRAADFAPQRKLAQLAESQLGTVGSGNHYVNLMEDEEGRIWVGVHFGSRGFGHKTASGFLALAQGLPFDGKAHEGEMDSPPVLFEGGSELGDAYLAAMQLAGDYAYAGRDVVVAKLLEILGAEAVHEVHNHHNFAWRESHFGRDYFVVRKGCTPARPGQEGFVGGSMGDESVILEGVESTDNEQALYSTVHGAGRVMSRSQAAGRIRRRNRWVCAHRDCTHVQEEAGTCPIHGSKLRKAFVEEQVKRGAVDWPAVQARLREQGIVLVGGGADEAPEVYKRLPEVLAAHGDTVRVKHTLRPLGVAMAGRDVYDPYKD